MKWQCKLGTWNNHDRKLHWLNQQVMADFIATQSSIAIWYSIFLSFNIWAIIILKSLCSGLSPIRTKYLMLFEGLSELEKIAWPKCWISLSVCLRSLLDEAHIEYNVRICHVTITWQASVLRQTRNTLIFHYTYDFKISSRCWLICHTAKITQHVSQKNTKT